MNCCSFTCRMNTASGSARSPLMAARVADRPRASAGTEADGFCSVKAPTAARTSTSMAESSEAAAGGAGRRIALNSPGIEVSIPSKKLSSLVRLKPDTTDEGAELDATDEGEEPDATDEGEEPD